MAGAFQTNAFQTDAFQTDSSSVSANAGVATGTGAAYNPSAANSHPAGVATGTGAAYGATAATSKIATAGRAAGTGTAYGATVIYPSAGPSAGLGAGTGAAFNPQVSAVSAQLEFVPRYMGGSKAVHVLADAIASVTPASAPFDVPRYDGALAPLLATGKSPSGMNIEHAYGPILEVPYYKGRSQAIHVFGTEDNPPVFPPVDPCIQSCGPTDGEYNIWDDFNNRTLASEWGPASSGLFNWLMTGSGGVGSVDGSTGRLVADALSNTTYLRGAYVEDLVNRIHVPFMVSFDVTDFLDNTGGSGGVNVLFELLGEDITPWLWCSLYLNGYFSDPAGGPISLLYTTPSGAFVTNGWYSAGPPITSGRVYVMGDETGVTVVAGSTTLSQPWRDLSGAPVTMGPTRTASVLGFNVSAYGTGKSSHLGVDNLRVKDKVAYGTFCTGLGSICEGTEVCVPIVFEDFSDDAVGNWGSNVYGVWGGSFNNASVSGGYGLLHSQHSIPSGGGYSNAVFSGAAPLRSAGPWDLTIAFSLDLQLLSGAASPLADIDFYIEGGGGNSSEILLSADPDAGLASALIEVMQFGSTIAYESRSDIVLPTNGEMNLFRWKFTPGGAQEWYLNDVLLFSKPAYNHFGFFSGTTLHIQAFDGYYGSTAPGETSLDALFDYINFQDCQLVTSDILFPPAVLPSESTVIFRRQIGDPTTTLDRTVCLLESAAMVLDWHTHGGVQVWGGELVPWCGRSEDVIRANGTSLVNAQQAWAHWGQYLDIRAGEDWTRLVAYLAQGRAVILGGEYIDLGIYRCDDFTGGHAIAVLPYTNASGSMMTGDPLCGGFHFIPPGVLQAFAEAQGVAFYGVRSPQPIYFAVSRPWTV